MGSFTGPGALTCLRSSLSGFLAIQEGLMRSNVMREVRLRNGEYRGEPLPWSGCAAMEQRYEHQEPALAANIVSCGSGVCGDVYTCQAPVRSASSRARCGAPAC